MISLPKSRLFMKKKKKSIKSNCTVALRTNVQRLNYFECISEKTVDRARPTLWSDADWCVVGGVNVFSINDRKQDVGGADRRGVDVAAYVRAEPSMSLASPSVGSYLG